MIAHWNTWRAGLAALCAGLALAGCALEPVAPVTSPAPTPRAVPPVVSEESLEAAEFYARFQQRQLTAGLMRTDGGGPDTPYNARQLAENFERIALFDEYTLRAGRFVAEQSESRLRRWAGPVRVQAIFGPATPPERKAQDSAALRDYTRRLARLTGADIRTSTGGGNYHVLFLNVDELRAAGPLLRELIPQIDDATLRDITTLDRFTFCSVYAISTRAEPYTYTTAVAIIRSEHPDLMRLSCIHEEIAQGLGLANDSPDARPSIFNDDDEFALLTSHDERLLQMLYDPRLTPGLTPEEARPLVRQIASEVMGGAS
ncbi:hypothetical protein Dshi_2793 [Dinoroseobacter shibae DFL 12 = DSM 16493]|jgi:hypothetical protein|uniref:Lipoprotein n=1 Tax=Dinoroseobacter shibae (strain DSM 16493 / NCIMB 14021 / DFL 12) TaxID=398580 RepID=A8LJ31_DINSH|nr:DUF2927 domain-containing protein [Dinoroseobacter shibae]ABV94526.1 hypothetical protein Dshi_2793 [Dinoroseobacter shibae DFL 12 = DSM 16493]URF45953.1 DUF2927 domain-containing protein [Dinoroseobacter shibae]URF50259.1 DUF2927 domain-containing protein [Dinoroseobacter shibae]